MELVDAINIVLQLARTELDRQERDKPVGQTSVNREACDMLEDYAVNELGDD